MNNKKKVLDLMDQRFGEKREGKQAGMKQGRRNCLLQSERTQPPSFLFFFKIMSYQFLKILYSVF